MASRKTVLDRVKRSKFEKVKLAVTDIDGILRGKVVHKKKFLGMAEKGFGFCDVVFGWDSSDTCYDNSKFTGPHTGYPDAHAVVDLETARSIPWESGLPFFLADFVDSDGDPLEVCPRQLLKSVIRKARSMGFDPVCAFEFEFFNFKETPDSLVGKSVSDLTPLSPGMFGYSILRSSLNQPYFAALMDDLKKFDVPLEGIHTETGPGVYEAAIMYAPALEAADRAVLFKTAAKEVANRHGFTASFMAKWNAAFPGCSGHFHQSLWKKGKNVFFDSRDRASMSATFQSYLAGQMELLPELMPFYLPNVNSYKRLVEGVWAPVNLSWGVENRTCAFRVIPGSSSSTRLETRITGSDVNPYLAAAAALASGLWGIEKRLKLKAKPVKGDACKDSKLKPLVRNLKDATEALKRSKNARKLLGDDFVDHYVRTREWEWGQFQRAVTDWEFNRYFEII